MTSSTVKSEGLDRGETPEEEEEEYYFDYFFEKQGSEPGTLTIDDEATPSHIVLIDYTRDRATRRHNLHPRECLPYLQTPSVSWIDIQGLGSEETLKQIGEVCSLHPLLLEDVVNVPQRPKVEDYNEQLLILVQMILPFPDGDGFDYEQVGFVLSENYLLTFQEDPSQDCFETVRTRIRENRGRVRQSRADYLAYLLIDTIIDGFFPVVEDYGDRIENLEEAVVDQPTRATLEEIYQVRRELLALRRTIWPHRNVVNILMRDDNSLITPEVRIYFRDCYDHIIQLLETIEAYRELASSLMDVYMSAISNKMNEVVKLLTLISTIFIPLTFVVGVYGMNFEYLPELKWRWGYFLCWAIMITIAATLLYFFWRRGWFENFTEKT